MTAPRVYQAEAIILRRTNFGEADKILSLYTPELGKVSAIAKGARRPGSKFGGHVEPLTHSVLLLAKGRNFDIVTQSQTIHSFISLKSDLWRLAWGVYSLELVDRFVEERMENRPIFDLLLNTLELLCGARDGEAILRYFELQLLHHLGYRPELEICIACGSALQPEMNYFSPRQGGTLCRACGCQEPAARLLSVNALKVFRLWQDCDYDTASRVRISRELAYELAMVMRYCISYLVECEVKSALWLDKLKQETPNIAVDNILKSD